jgi:hypothetical protein
MAARFDLSEWLIHFTRGDSPDLAFATLQAIIAERRLISGNRFIRGGYRCVCFTEAPLPAFTDDFVRQFPFARYSQFGVMFPKAWLYEQGGRPVIYQPDADFDLLPEQLKWRYVRFELDAEPVIDWTWEREWRIRCDELWFSEADAVIVVPDSYYASVLQRIHDDAQDIEVELYATIVDLEVAEMWRAREVARRKKPRKLYVNSWSRSAVFGHFWHTIFSNKLLFINGIQ